MEREGIDFLYDTNTNNRSFLEMSYLLKQKNVVNNKFMLKLYDSTLSGVDVYSKSLTTEQKARIYQEICRNFWYFLREGLKIPAAGTTEGIRFQLNVGNMAAAFCCINNINHMLTVPRQVGKTVVEVSFSLWVFGFSGSYITETYLHKAQSGAVDNLRRLKQYKELLPDWLQELISANDDKDNLEEKVNSKRTNRIVALSSAQNDAAADKLGRGSSTAMVYMDEFAFLERNEIVWGALIPAWRTTAGVAKQNGAPYGIRITTTPNNLSLPHASFCYNMIKEKAARFTYANYDIPEDKFEEYLDNNSANGFFYIEYSWKECGKDQKWYNDQAKLMDAATVKRELENDWPESDEGSIFKDEQLDLIKHYLKDPLFTLNVNDYQIVFYERPDFLMNYIISCDVSGGLSQDRSVLLIIHPGDFHIVGSFINARIDTDSFRNLIFTLATQYFIHAIINIENNSYGLAILDVLMKNNLIEPRMYRETVERQGEKTLHDGTVVKSPMKKIQYGTNTNAKSRGLMFDILPGIVDEEPEVFVFKEFRVCYNW